MPRIEVLDIATANRIAAGEVVERPASVIKELVENALDAGASAITVEIRKSEYLRVTDNGSGIAPGQMRVAFERHATSKLRSGDALDRILTLGFRGEALPSIAAVSKIEVTSRQRGQDSGARLTAEGGVFGELREAGCPEGTTVVVKELFYNTPARRAFMKKEQVEAGYAQDAVLQLALARHDVSFRLVASGKTLFHTPGTGDLDKTLQVLFGREIGKGLVSVEGKLPGGEVRGVLGLQDAARGNRQREYFIVNGRVVRSPLLATALEEAVRGSIAPGKYPFCALFVNVPPESVDVNVHPTKLEVRFRDEPSLRLALFEAVQAGLHSPDAPAVPLFAQPLPEPEPLPRLEPVLPQAPRVSEASEPGFSMPMPAPPQPPPGAMYSDAPPVVREYLSQTIVPPEPVEMDMGETPHRVVGVLFATYILVEQGEEFLLIDQHAAHERLLYEELMRSMERGSDVQHLLVPYTIDVTPRERERLLESMSALEGLGFCIEEFGPWTFRVTAVPHILGEPQLRDFFIELVGQLDSIAQLKAAQLKRDAIARIACHKAVKGGDRLSDQELSHLLRAVMGEDMPLTCPHGRPIMLKMTRAQIERRIRRAM